MRYIAHLTMSDRIGGPTTVAISAQNREEAIAKFGKMQLASKESGVKLKLIEIDEKGMNRDVLVN